MTGHVVPIRTYFFVFVALMALLVLTVVVSWIPLGSGNLAVAMTIGIIKATLIILFFMHVRYSSKLVWVFAASSFVWLAIMLLITFSDYLSRGWIPIGPR
jgi:cytochrome c oxidase subunit 4